MRRTSLRYRTNVGPSNLSYCRISLIPSSASASYTMVLSLLPHLLTVTGYPARDHSLLPFVPVLRNMGSSCTTIVNPRLFAPDIVPVTPACRCLTESASVAEASW